MYKRDEGTYGNGVSQAFLSSMSTVFTPTTNTGKRDWDMLVDNDDDLPLQTPKRVRFDQSQTVPQPQPSSPAITTYPIQNLTSSAQPLASTHIQSQPIGPGGTKLVGLMKENSDKTSLYNKKFAVGLGVVNSNSNFLRKLRLPWETDRQSSAQEEVNVMKKAVLAFQNKGRFSPGLYNDLVNLSDDTFERLLSRHQGMDTDILNMITTFLWAKNAEGELVTEDKRKFVAIARYGIYPKIISEPSSLRNLFQSYEKLVAIDQEVVIDHLLMPLLNSVGTFPRILYQGINTYKFLVKILDQLAANDTALDDQNVLKTLTFLIDKQQEYLPPPASNTMYKLLEISLQTRPKDPKIGSFYYLIMKKFIGTMTDDDITAVASLNYYNLTSWKPHVDALVAEHAKSSAYGNKSANNNDYVTSSVKDSIVNMKFLSEQLNQMSATEEQMDMD